MKRLPDSELEIMMIIWELNSKVTRADIEEKLDKEKDWSPTTILSLLSRLQKKKFVKVDKEGKNNVYSALVSEDEYMNAESKTLLERMYKNSVKNFMMALYSEDKPSKKEIDELKEFLDELKKEDS